MILNYCKNSEILVKESVISNARKPHSDEISILDWARLEKVDLKAAIRICSLCSRPLEKKSKNLIFFSSSLEHKLRNQLLLEADQSS